MSDLIDREALLRQIDIDSEGEPGYYGDTWKFIDTIKRMPSALGTNLASLGTDLISRQAAIERFDYIRPRDPMTSDYTHGIDVGIALCKVAIREQPLAQLSTNLAEVGTDCISREQAIKALERAKQNIHHNIERAIGDAICEILDEVENGIKQLPPIHPVNNSEMPNGSDVISRQAAIDEIKEIYEWHDNVTKERIIEHFVRLPSAQPERTCVNCGRTVNNGGWYADGRTRCPIEEHYALPKDGYCHLWEKRNVTDDDYPERQEVDGERRTDG